MRFCFFTMDSQAKKVQIETIKMMMVARALISGDRPRRTEEKISIGSVVESGPAMKLAITRSSIDMVKASKKAATSDGIKAGKITAKKTLIGPAPKSIAASSMEISNSRKRERITTVV